MIVVNLIFAIGITSLLLLESSTQVIPVTLLTDGPLSTSPSDGISARSSSDGTSATSPSDGTSARSSSADTSAISPSDGTSARSSSDGTSATSPSDGEVPRSSSDGTSAILPKDGTSAKLPNDGTSAKLPKDGTSVTLTKDGNVVTTTLINPTVKTTKAPFVEPICNEDRPTGLYAAQNCNQYYKCNHALWYYSRELLTCPKGEHFDNNEKSCVEGTCSDDDSVTDNPAPSPAPFNPPSCAEQGSGLYPATQCDQYYQCRNSLWYSERTLMICPEGEHFDKDAKLCAKGYCSADGSVITGPAPPPFKVPTCDSPEAAGKHPARQCNQYYKCSHALWYYSNRLVTCPEGEHFDKDLNKCDKGYC